MGNETSEFRESLRDFRVFLYYIWKHLALPDPTPIQYDIANYLQHGPKRKIIQAFRGVGKSWVTSAYVLWKLYWNPQYKILVVSASKERADAFSTFTLRLINDVPWLQHLRPDNSTQRSSKISFDVGPAKPDHAPSVKSVGIFGQLTGSRADVIIADDIEVANNSFTQGMRDKLSETVKEFDSILKPDKHAEITYLGTPQTEMSLYNILQERGYSCRIWPARVPGAKERESYGDRLAPIIEAMTDEGHTTEPLRFSDSNLMEREASQGRSGFALQFMLNTTLSDKERFPLRLTDMMVMSLNPELAPEKPIWAACPETRVKDLNNLGFNGDGWYSPMSFNSCEWRPYELSIMFVDPSGRGADETSWAVIKSQGTNLYLVSAGGHRFGYDEQGMRILIGEAKKHGVQKILIESNFGDGMFTKLFTAELTKDRAYSCTVEEVNSRGQKELRIIDSCEPILNQHRLIVDRKVIESDFNDAQDNSRGSDNGFLYSLFYQLTHISKDRGSLRHDDRLDALAGCVAYFAGIMDANQERLIEAARDRDREIEHEVFLSETAENGLFDMYLITGNARLAVEKCGSGSYRNKRWVSLCARS